MAFDRIEAMRAFCRIVEVGSFTLAAESLAVAKTTVSGQVKALEAFLGLKLLHRTTRRVAPTTDGAAYYERARMLLEDLDELESSALQNRSVVRGRVRVEMPSGLSTCLLLPALPQFQAKYPHIQLDIGCSERVVDLVQEGVDCAFRGGAVNDPNLVSRPVGVMRFCLCAAPSYLAQQALINHPDDLLGQRYLGFTFPGTGKPLITYLNQAGQRFAIEQMPAMRFNHAGVYLAAGVAGQGIVAVPRAEVVGHFARGELVEVLPDWQVDGMPMNLVYPATRHLSARVRAVLDWGIELLANDPLWALP